MTASSPDSTPCISNSSAISELPPDLTYCQRCKSMVPVDSMMPDRPWCRGCHNKQVRDKWAEDRRTGRQQRFRKLQHELRRRNTPEALLALIECVARESSYGSIPALAREWGRHLSDSDLSLTARLAAQQTLLHVCCVAELATIAENDGAAPESLVRALHRQGKLAPILQSMYKSGEVDLDDVDPPPGA